MYGDGASIPLIDPQVAQEALDSILEHNEKMVAKQSLPELYQFKSDQFIKVDIGKMLSKDFSLEYNDKEMLIPILTTP